MIALAALLLALPGLSPAPFPPDADVLFHDDFASGSLEQWSDRQRAVKNRIVVVPAPSGRRGKAARFEVRQGDEGFPGDAGDRAELAWWESIAREGDRGVYRWSLFFPLALHRDRRWQDVVQWKNEGPGTPPLQLGIGGGCLRLEAGDQLGHRTLWRAPLEQGRWHDFALLVRWSADPRGGSLTLEHDGRRVLDDVRLATLYEGAGNYFKLGLYRNPAIATPATIYATDVMIQQVDPAALPDLFGRPPRALGPDRCR
jgi:hypothetical protein